MRCCIPLLAALLACATDGVQAQSPHAHAAPATHSAAAAEDAATAAFMHAARRATEQYRDRAAAIADGFRLLGPDFPAMGEHWIHPGRMVDGTLDPARPQALSYARIDGRPVLLGVIYARPLRGAELPPAFPAAGLPWHDHVRTIDEEGVLLHHVPTGSAGDQGVRLAMLHAWVWTENPDGVFAPDNWALPFIRLHLEVPARIDPAAARALSLATGGDAYYSLLFHALVSPTPQQVAAMQDRIRSASARVLSWYVQRSVRSAPPTESDQAELGEVWRTLWRASAADLAPEASARLRGLIDPDTKDSPSAIPRI